MLSKINDKNAEIALLKAEVLETKEAWELERVQIAEEAEALLIAQALDKQ